MVLELARPSEAWCFPPGADFSKLFYCQQPQATESLEKCCFSKISDDTLGSFLAWFWNWLVLQRHGVTPRELIFSKLFYC